MEYARRHLFHRNTAGFGSLIRPLLVLACCLVSTLVSAQTTDTLEKLRKTRVIAIGVRDNSLPFSTLSQGMATGYSVELCSKVVDQLRKELKLPDLKVQYVPVTAADRITKVKDGVVDIECGQTVNTRSRQVDVSFSFSHFVAAERIMVRSGSGIADINGLAGKSVAVVKGTTGEKLFSQLRDSQLRTMKLETYGTAQEALKALETGKVAAIGQLDVVLESLRLQSGTPDRYEISKDPLSVEPMALMLRKDDTAFRAIVDKTLAALYSSGEINAIYDRWLNAGGMQVPVSRMLKECWMRPSHEPGVALGLGYSL